MARKKRFKKNEKHKSPNKGFGKSVLFLVALAVITSVFIAINSKGNKTIAKKITPSQSQKNNVSPSFSNVDNYASKGSINTWPNIQSNQSKSTPYSDQKNLLANNYYLILDASGSMADSGCSGGKTKMAASIDALEQFLLGAPKDANYGLSVFNNGGFKELVELKQQNDWQSTMRLLRNNLTPSGGTPLALATNAAQKKLEEQARKQLGYGEYNLVLITDGLASKGQDPKRVVDQILQNTPLNLSVIGFCIDENNVLNQPGYIQYRTATDPESLKESLQSVLAESVDFNVSGFNQ